MAYIAVVFAALVVSTICSTKSCSLMLTMSIAVTFNRSSIFKNSSWSSAKRLSSKKPQKLRCSRWRNSLLSSCSMRTTPC
ncbi:hypothetical protein D3C84_904540 [compost metagenome]